MLSESESGHYVIVEESWEGSEVKPEQQFIFDPVTDRYQ